MASGELWRSTAQVGVESTYGTAVAATRIVYLNGQPVMGRTRAPRPHMFATGTRDNQRAATLGPSEVGGSVALPLSADEILEWLLVTLKGGVTPTTPTGATNGRLWTFVPGSTALDSMTLEFDDAARAHRAYGVYGNSMAIAGSANGEATATFELLGIEREQNALTGSLTSRVPTFIEGWETIVYLDAFGSTTGGIAQIPNFAASWNVQITNNLGRKYLANNRNRVSRIVTGTLGIKASLVVEAVSAQAATELANWDAVTKRLVTLEFGRNEAISGDTAVNEVQTLTMGGTPTGGTIVMSLLGQSFTLDYNSSSSAAQTAINAALTAAFGSDYTVAVSGGAWPGSALVVTGNGTALAGRNLPGIVTVTNSLTGGTSPAVTVVETTPGYPAKRYIRVEIPAFWDAVDIGQTGDGTRQYSLSADYVYDPTNSLPVRVSCLSSRATAW